MSIQVSVTPEVSYLGALLEQCRQGAVIEADWLEDLRHGAAAIVQELAIPSKREEEWRFTDLSSLLQVQFQAVNPQSISSGQPLDISPFTLPETAQSCLVFINGVYAPQLSTVKGLPEGAFVGNLAEFPPQYISRLQKYLGKQQGTSEVFTALNTAGLTDVAVVWATKNTIVEQPIQLLFISTTEAVPIICQPRCLVVAEAGSQLHLVEDYAANVEGCPDIPLNKPYFTNQVTEIWVEENAAVTHTRNQREAADGFHIGKTAIAQARNSRYIGNGINLGAKLSRHNWEVWQTGEGTQTTLNGLTMISGEQLADTHSAIALKHPHGTSNQLHKCIVDGSARAVFNGKVYVPHEAQFTNASQLNRNLLLSPKARVDTKPQLEITADQVKCSHGATISQLEADEIFYLQSRGLNEVDARNLLIDAFVAEILDSIPVASLSKRLASCASCRTY
ncbi:MAG: Fe-S cluster assembly protein SufD [Symploca sp. SIO1A3]|nr:Fe-S cluster assembly protein SufD [Symploca sp. SIO1A3]